MEYKQSWLERNDDLITDISYGILAIIIIRLFAGLLLIVYANQTNESAIPITYTVYQNSNKFTDLKLKFRSAHSDTSVFITKEGKQIIFEGSYVSIEE